ncbi:long-chain fatty acid--CoA ligase [Rhabdobacter roseus]|uniref:Long-chain-fatty-acid--CoA ligase n=1 Tax=Rhabdobacter roseus TaxID=1655419 RepID=A0A840TVX5_9BACT|nr:AMP-binding protein [Rhabdobacter roseus]MBB5285413.1 long-chain acyl-CoA synthetase [Rhabdobacter roseus]
MSNTTTKTYPWLKYYPEGVPHEINPDRYPSLLEMMEEGFQAFASHPAYANMGKEMTFGELDRLSRAFAAYLQSLGLQKGDRIAIQMPNLLQYPIAMFGALRAGLVVVNTNPLYTPREMQHQFKDSGAKAIVILANFAHHLEKIIAKTDLQHVIVTQIGDLLGTPKKWVVNAVVKYVKKMVPAYSLPGAISFGKALSEGSSASYQRPQLASTDLAFIQYTGGTTGVSKGAMLTHRNLIANVEANNEWLKPMTGELANGKKPVIVAALPLYHVYALTVNALSALKSGGMNLLITNPRDMNAFINDLKKYQVTIFTGLNTLYNGLLNNPRFGEVDFSQLKVTSAGGMALQTAVAERWKKATGCLPAEGYGLSETSPVLSSNPLKGENRIGTIGVPWPSTEMRILREDNTWADVGEAGEICAQGPQVMPGYYNRPDETAKVMFEDESGQWFKTGDIGVQDQDGFFKIVDRKKDMILVSGFNVYPNEVEEVMAQHPGIMEVACVGVPCDKSTEAVKIFVVKKDEALTVEDVKKYCREHLTAYKCPKHVEFREELPKTNVGKILRRALRDEEVAKAK